MNGGKERDGKNWPNMVKNIQVTTGICENIVGNLVEGKFKTRVNNFK